MLLSRRDLSGEKAAHHFFREAVEGLGELFLLFEEREVVRLSLDFAVKLQHIALKFAHLHLVQDVAEAHFLQVGEEKVCQEVP